MDSNIGSRELRAPILAQGVSCDIAPLSGGDAMFAGYGPDGEMHIGIERKKLHDILACIDDARYNAQRVVMGQMYQVSCLYIEGLWKCREDGTLMEGFRDYKAEHRVGSREVIAWTPLKMGPRHVMYYTLYRYLRSVAHTGVIIVYTRDVYHTVTNIVNDYHYYQKKWHEHRSMREVHAVAVASLTSRPKLVRKWAQACDGIGVVLGEEAARYFKVPVKLANASEQDWMKIGTDVGTAQRIVREIQGW